MEINKDSTIVVTGGAGFIGSNLIRSLNEKGINKIIIVDNFENNKDKWKNLMGLNFLMVLDLDSFCDSILNADSDIRNIDLFIHLGGRSDTRADFMTLFELNYKATLAYLSFCVGLNIPFFYASSAATYGNTDLFSDHHELIPTLDPNNAYAMSKHMVDLASSKQENIFKIACGMKFFNVYGPGEMHKGLMASIIGRALVLEDKFEFCHVDHWERDFIYVEDVVDIILFLVKNDGRGIYNVGSGECYSWENVYNRLLEVDPNLKDKLSLVKNPKVLPSFFNENYQKYSKADISKLKGLGYKKKILSLTEGIQQYKKVLD